MLTDYLLFILSALAVAAVAFLYIHFLFHIIAGGEDDFDAATSQAETPTLPEPPKEEMAEWCRQRRASDGDMC